MKNGNNSTAVVLRFLTGASLSLVYPPSLKVPLPCACKYSFFVLFSSSSLDALSVCFLGYYIVVDLHDALFAFFLLIVLFIIVVQFCSYPIIVLPLHVEAGQSGKSQDMVINKEVNMSAW